MFRVNYLNNMQFPTFEGCLNMTEGNVIEGIVVEGVMQ